MEQFMNNGIPPNSLLDQISRSLSAQQTPKRSTPLNALGDWLNPPPINRTGLLGNYLSTLNPPVLGDVSSQPQKLALPLVSAPLVPRARRVFYSFHYADVHRVNQVRQSGKIRSIDSERVKTVQDKSLWERKKSINEEYLRRSVSQNIAGTSATCILTGRDTWERPWCRFEIARSLLNGNGIFAVRIDHLYCIGQRCFGTFGPNPLDYMAVGRDISGRIQVYEFVDDGWYVMQSMSKRLLGWPKWLQPVEKGFVRPLSTSAPIYDYDSQNGAKLLLLWANQAARAAGR